MNDDWRIVLNFSHCDLPFDSFDLEALDRLAQGGESFDFAQDREPVERLVEPFGIFILLFGLFYLSKPETSSSLQHVGR